MTIIIFLSFADFLYERGDYYRAAVEYIREAYKKNDDSLFFRGAECYMLSKKYEIAKSLLKWMYREKKDPERALYLLFEIAIAQKEDVDSIFKELKNTRFKRKAMLSYIQYNVLKKDFKRALELLKEIELPHKEEIILLLSSPVYKKSPWIAGAISIVPGAGHLYVGRVEDGLFSFFINLVFFSAFYYYFKNNETLKAGITGGLGVLFWAGNIYGAINAALDYNDYQEKRRIEMVNALIEGIKE